MILLAGKRIKAYFPISIYTHGMRKNYRTTEQLNKRIKKSEPILLSPQSSVLSPQSSPVIRSIRGG